MLHEWISEWMNTWMKKCMNEWTDFWNKRSLLIFPFGVISNESFCFWNKMLLNSCFDITLFLLKLCKTPRKSLWHPWYYPLPREAMEWGVFSCATRNFPLNFSEDSLSVSSVFFMPSPPARWGDGQEGLSDSPPGQEWGHKTITLIDGSLGRHAQGFTKKSQAISSN